MNVLAKIEKDNGMMSKDVAEKLRITKGYYSMLKNGVRPMSKEIGLRIHELYGIPLEAIFFPQRVDKKSINSTGSDG